MSSETFSREGARCKDDRVTPSGGVRPLPDRLTLLARATSELIDAASLEAVSRTVVTHGAEAVGATVASVTLLGDDQHTVQLVALSGGIAGDEETWGTFPLSYSTPSAETIRTGRRIVVTGARAITDRFADMPSRGARTVVALPLNGGNGVIGAIGLSFTEPRELEEAELEFLDILANACAQSLGRMAAQREAAHQTAKLVFLAEAAAELASSLPPVQSSPARGYSSVGRAPGSHPGGRGFESP